jgi:hypothetical protein
MASHTAAVQLLKALGGCWAEHELFSGTNQASSQLYFMSTAPLPDGIQIPSGPG